MDERTLALALFDAGAIKFGEFELKIHEQYPKAPRSPIYLNLRMPPKGVLTDDLIAEIGEWLYDIADSKDICYQRVVGLPKAGNPLAKAFITASDGILRPEELLYLEKEETEIRRRILSVIEGEFQEEEIVLVLDDLITKAGTKIEGIEAIRSNKLRVTDCIVFVDREQGGKEQLAEYGVKLHSAFTLTKLLDIYQESGRISDKTRQDVAEYAILLEEYINENQI